MASSSRPILKRIYAGLSMAASLRTWPAVLALLLCTTILYSIAVLKPASKASPPSIHPSPCRDAGEGYALQETAICTDTCGRLCFPRVHGICFGRSQVTLCDRRSPSQEIKAAGGEPPPVMRLCTDRNPREKVRVRHGRCPGRQNSAGTEWIPGLHMVADLSLMPTGRVGPNPHHESEKIIPAILFTHRYGLQNSTLYWFADPKDPLMISSWSHGLLDAFSDGTRVHFLRLPGHDERPVCFEDAILFAGATTSGYIPSQQDHAWLRERILMHCRIPSREVGRPVQNGMLVHRPNSVRNIANFEAVKGLLEQELRISLSISVRGASDFCTQVRDAAEADVIVTPHGSHNVNLVAARPGALLLEAFPFLYYIDWYSHYLHAGRVVHRELYGTAGEDWGRVSLRMRLYYLVYGWERCFFVRSCMNHGKEQPIYVDLDQLQSILRDVTGGCSLIVRNSSCMQSFF